MPVSLMKNVLIWCCKSAGVNFVKLRFPRKLYFPIAFKMLFAQSYAKISSDVFLISCILMAIFPLTLFILYACAFSQFFLD